jgi:hypothetical protein
MNQREFTRVRTAIPVDITVDGRTIAGQTKDVSLNGCYVATTETAPVEGSACRITLHLDGRGGALVVVGSGEVARRRDDGFAVHIDELFELESYEHLRNLIRYNAEDPDQADREFGSHLGLKRIDPHGPPPG